MPARLHFSNSLDALAERLLENLSRSDGDPFDAPVIATPASALRDWLKIKIAVSHDVAANLSFHPLETLLWDLLAERDRHRDDPDRLPARLLDTFSFQGLVLDRLRNDPPVALRDWLKPQDAEKHPEDAARRLCQLSGQLASLFREYEYNRVAEYGFPSLAESWMSGLTSFERHLLRGSAAIREARSHLAEVRALEAWQMDVYQSLFRPGGLRDRWGEATKTYRYTLPQYAEMAFGDPVIPAGMRPTFHLFGLSNISPFHRDLIGRLADATRLGEGAARFEIYALNPCAEFWEDALTLRERRARGPRTLAPGAIALDRVIATQPDDDERASGELREEDRENGLLALFGKPGRETIKLWCQLTDHDFNEDFQEPPGESLLVTLQRMVLHRQGPLEDRCAPATNDRSLRFAVANDARAELEAVRDEIAMALRDDSKLRPEDIAVIPADASEGMVLLRAVFAGDDRVPGNVPVLLPDGDGMTEGALLAGFRALLELATSDITRETLLELLGNPIAQSATGLDFTRLPMLERILEEAGFARGWGREQDGVQGASTLSGALERLLASMALDAEDPHPATNHSLEQPVPGVVERMEREETNAMLEWLSKLRDATRPLRNGTKRSFADWAATLRALRDALLPPAAADPRDARDLRRFLDELEAWGEWEGTEAGSVDATLVVMLFADRFRGVEGAGRAVYLRGGVRIGELSALRGIPFRRVWITGLTSAFPATGDAMPLDLRAFRRLPGESDPAARDLYALLEVLASCSDSASLSWHRRAADGKERQPSRALTGLTAWLESDVLPAGATIGFAEISASPQPAPAPADHTPVIFAKESAQARVRKLTDIGYFLRNPVMHATERMFRSEDWEALDEAEPGLSGDLFVDSRKGASLIDACLRAELEQPGAAPAAFDALWTTWRRGGLLPPAPWNAAEKERLRAELQGRLDGEIADLRVILDATGLRFAGTLRLGPQGTERANAPVINRPPFDAAPLGFELRLGVVLPWFFRGPDGWALRVDPDRDMIAYLVQLCVAGLSPLPPLLAETFKGTGRLLVRAKGGGSLTELPLPEIPTDTARMHLRDLLADFTRALGGEGHLDDVPLDEIAAVIQDTDGDPDAIGDWSEAILASRGEADEHGRERVGRAERRRRAIDPSIPAEIGAIVERRVLPYLRWKESLLLDAAAPGGNEDRDAA